MSTVETSGPALRSLPAHRSLRDEITETLRAAVITGEMQTGVVYSAPSLAEQFGVSATPVREAMLDLVREGLVVTHRNKGFRVMELSSADLDNIVHLRSLIEIPTVADIARRGGDPEAMTRLRELADDIETAAREQDAMRHISVDMDFHTTLLAMAGNPYLVDTVRALRSQSRLYGLRPLAERNQLLASAREHAQILDLIEKRDTAGARKLMAQHLGHVRGQWSNPDSDA